MTTVWEWQSAACCDWNGEEKVEMISGEKYSEELVMASPILRPMSDLFVKITERDYNDGKPFIPISELANIVEGAGKCSMGIRTGRQTNVFLRMERLVFMGPRLENIYTNFFPQQLGGMRYITSLQIV